MKRFSVELHLFSVDLCVTVYFTELHRVKNENHRGMDQKNQYHSLSSLLVYWRLINFFIKKSGMKHVFDQGGEIEQTGELQYGENHRNQNDQPDEGGSLFNGQIRCDQRSGNRSGG